MFPLHVFIYGVYMVHGKHVCAVLYIEERYMYVILCMSYNAKHIEEDSLMHSTLASCTCIYRPLLLHCDQNFVQIAFNIRYCGTHTIWYVPTLYNVCTLH